MKITESHCEGSWLYERTLILNLQFCPAKMLQNCDDQIPKLFPLIIPRQAATIILYPYIVTLQGIPAELWIFVFNNVQLQFNLTFVNMNRLWEVYPSILEQLSWACEVLEPPLHFLKGRKYINGNIN